MPYRRGRGRAYGSLSPGPVFPAGQRLGGAASHACQWRNSPSGPRAACRRSRSDRGTGRSPRRGCRRLPQPGSSRRRRSAPAATGSRLSSDLHRAAPWHHGRYRKRIPHPAGQNLARKAARHRHGAGSRQLVLRREPPWRPSGLRRPLPIEARPRRARSAQ